MTSIPVDPKWESVGPFNAAGRIGCLVRHPVAASKDTLYAGASAGGVWMTTDGGAHWTSKMTGQECLAIGGLAIAASDPQVIYAATGEWTDGVGWLADPVIRGVGIYRSPDGGKTWEHRTKIGAGAFESEFCAAAAVHPGDADIVYVAGEKALHRSTDGGATWHIEPGQDLGLRDGPASDVVVNPDNPDEIFFAMHGAGVFRWKPGDPYPAAVPVPFSATNPASAPKIAFGPKVAGSPRLIAVKSWIDVFLSADGGATFARAAGVFGDPQLASRTAWANAIAIDPGDPLVILAGGQHTLRSTDGGGAWTRVGGGGIGIAGAPYDDCQAIVFDPDTPGRVFVATDGGISQSLHQGDHLQAWKVISAGVVASHFYTLGVSQTAVCRFGGALQDSIPMIADDKDSWEFVGLAEGGFLEIDPSDESVVYNDTFAGNLVRSRDAGKTFADDLKIDTDDHYATSLAISRQDPKRLLAIDQVTNGLQLSVDGVQFNPVPVAGAPAMVSAVAFDPGDDNSAYAGSETGKVWRSTDQGLHWTELAALPAAPAFGLAPGALPATKVQRIVVDPGHPEHIYVALKGERDGHLLRGDLDAAGTVTWFELGSPLNPDFHRLPLTGLIVHPSVQDTLFVSTLDGVYVSTDGGFAWAPYGKDLPTVFISDLDLREPDEMIYAATMGRGAWRCPISEAVAAT